MAHGAYGIAVTGMRGDPRAAGLVDVGDDAPVIDVRVVPFEAGAGRPTTEIGDDQAHLRLLTGGWLHMDREQRTATFHLPFELSDMMLAHPYLGPVGGLWARWSGREAFHCGAVLVDGTAWALLGPKEAGKSTTVAWLAARGFDVMTDDLLVVEFGPRPVCHVGPRFIDLRAPTAQRLLDDGIPQMLVEVRDGERHRFPLGDAPPTAPLGGFLLLEEADDISIEHIPPAGRLQRISEHRMVRLLPTDPVGLLDLVPLPTAVLRRPKDFDRMDSVATAITDFARTFVPAGTTGNT
jgi:hypothetical protein